MKICERFAMYEVIFFGTESFDGVYRHCLNELPVTDQLGFIACMSVKKIVETTVLP